MANWYVKRGSETAGPLTQDRIKELAAQVKIEETDLIRKGDQGDFFPAGQIPGLLPDPDEAQAAGHPADHARAPLHHCPHLYPDAGV